MKFSCPHCGQHISCDELWSGHQIQCPACQNSLIVPHRQPPPSAAASGPKPLVSQPPAPSRPKLSGGSTQVARSTPPGGLPRRQPPARPPKTGNPVLKFAVTAVVLTVVGVAAYSYLPGLLTHVQEAGTSKPAAPANASSGGGAGPLGEVDAAMDVSDALDGGSPPRRPAAPATQPAASRPSPTTQPAVPRPSPTPATNSATKSPRRRPR
jgi:hypothetical protein